MPSPALILLFTLALPTAEAGGVAVPREGPATGGTARVGVVVDERGAPVAGAEVRIEPRSLTMEDLQGILGWRARTTVDGRFRLYGLRPGVLYRLIASHEKFAPTLAFVQSGPRPLRLVLSPGRTAAGRVVDAAGRPVAGARVELRRSLPGENYLRLQGPLDDSLYPAWTDQDGRFVLPHLAFRHADLTVRAAGYLRFEAPALLLPPPPGTANLGTFTLTRGKTVQGRVTDPTGHPIPGAEIWEEVDDQKLQRDNSASYLAAGPAAVAGPDGAFTLAADPRGGAILVCREGYLTERLEWQGPSPQPLAPVLHKAGRIEGRVVAPDGSPVVNSHIGLELAGQGGSDSWGPPGPCPTFPEGNLTDVQGRFTLSPLYSGWYEVYARADGFLRPPSPDRVSLLASGAQDQTVTGKDGSFALRVASGTYEISTLAADFLDHSRPVEVAGAPVTDLAIVLRPGATLHGRVLGLAPGDPFQVEGRRGEDHWTRFGNDGTYRVQSLAPGEWAVTASLAERPLLPTHQVTRRITVPAGPAEVNLDFTLPLGHLTLTSRPSRPLGRGMEIRLRSPGHPDLVILPSYEAGVLRFHRLLPGPYLLRVEGPQGRVLTERRIELAADSEVELEVPQESPP